MCQSNGKCLPLSLFVCFCLLNILSVEQTIFTMIVSCTQKQTCLYVYFSKHLNETLENKIHFRTKWLCYVTWKEVHSKTKVKWMEITQSTNHLFFSSVEFVINSHQLFLPFNSQTHFLCLCMFFVVEVIERENNRHKTNRNTIIIRPYHAPFPPTRLITLFIHTHKKKRKPQVQQQQRQYNQRSLQSSLESIIDGEKETKL